MSDWSSRLAGLLRSSIILAELLPQVSFAIQVATALPHFLLTFDQLGKTPIQV